MSGTWLSGRRGAEIRERIEKRWGRAASDRASQQQADMNLEMLRRRVEYFPDFESFLDPMARLPVTFLGLPEILRRLVGGYGLQCWTLVILNKRGTRGKDLCQDIPWIMDLPEPEPFIAHLGLFRWALLACPGEDLARSLLRCVPRQQFGERLYSPEGETIWTSPSRIGNLYRFPTRQRDGAAGEP